MAQSVEEFKREWRDKIKNNPAAYFPEDQKSRLQSADSSQFSVEFGSDKAIQDHLEGRAAASLCCVACATAPFGIKICLVPQGGDCDNMCL